MLNALLVRKEWLDRILAGKKTWEIRGSRTQKRGLIALVQSQSGTVVGTAELVDCLGPLTLDELNANMDKVGDTELWDDAGYDRPHAWVLRAARRLAKPVPYEHPPGAVIWVKLVPAVGDEVLAQVSKTATRTCD